MTAETPSLCNPFDSEVSLFTGVGATTKGKATVRAIMDGIRRGEFKDKILRLRAIRKVDKDQYKTEKKTLVSATLGGFFSYRDLENLVRPSGFFSGDIDHLDDIAHARESIIRDPLTAFCFVSPSGEGLKIGVKVNPRGLDNAKYHALFDQLQKHYQREHGVSLDETRKDITGLCFMSHDPDLFFNPISEVLVDSVASPEEPQAAPAPPNATDVSAPDEEARRRYCLDSLKRVCDVVRDAGDGTRNHTLNKQAFLVGGLIAAGGLSREEAETALEEAGKAAGLSDEETTATVRSGLDKGMAKPIDLSGIDGSKPQFSSLVGESLNPEEWQKAICFLEKATLPKFPAECLPAAMRGYVDSVSDCKQVPVDLPAMLAMSVAAAAGARKYRVYIGNTHNEPLNIWTVCALPPGSRKTDAFNAMMFPLVAEQVRLTEAKKPTIDAARAHREIQDKRAAHLCGLAAKEENPEKREKLTKEYIELKQAAAEIPAYPQLVISGDTTPEALAELVAAQGGKIAVTDTEGGFFSILAGRYDSKGEANLDTSLKLHSGGDDLTVIRKNRPPVNVAKPSGTFALTVQPGVIEDLTSKKEFRDRGLLGRFLYSIPESLIGTRLYQDKEVNQESMNLYAEVISKIFVQPEQWAESVTDRAPHHKLHIRGEAHRIWIDFCNDVEKRQGPGGDLSGVRDWASKSASAVARIAGIFHIVETGGDPSNTEIPAETVRRACVIGNRYLIAHMKAAYGMSNTPGDEQLARCILTWVSAEGKNTFTASDFWEANRSKAKRLDDLLPGFELLEDRGIVRKAGKPIGGDNRGRRARYRYEFNPTCLGCFRCLKTKGS